MLCSWSKPFPRRIEFAVRIRYCNTSFQSKYNIINSYILYLWHSRFNWIHLFFFYEIFFFSFFYSLKSHFKLDWRSKIKHVGFKNNKYSNNLKLPDVLCISYHRFSEMTLCRVYQLFTDQIFKDLKKHCNRCKVYPRLFEFTQVAITLNQYNIIY